jgi:hypothetical protein
LTGKVNPHYSQSSCETNQREGKEAFSKFCIHTRWSLLLLYGGKKKNGRVGITRMDGWMEKESPRKKGGFINALPVVQFEMTMSQPTHSQ